MARTVDGLHLYVENGDLPVEAVTAAASTGLVAWDLETTGLDCKTDFIATAQVFVPGAGIYLIRRLNSRPTNLCALLATQGVVKVFHHAVFDLSFMQYHWMAAPTRVACTKVASKILNPQLSRHSLADLALDYLGIALDKHERMSDWRRPDLTASQLAYAARDVIHLPNILESLKIHLQRMDRWRLAEAAFAYIPTNVTLRVLGLRDVFEY